MAWDLDQCLGCGVLFPKREHPMLTVSVGPKKNPQNPKPQTLNPQPSTFNPKPYTLTSQPCLPNAMPRVLAHLALPPPGLAKGRNVLRLGFCCRV